MTTYTDIEGKSIILCDHCRCDMPQGGPAFTLSPGKVAEGYVSRNYDRTEMVLCAACARIVGQIMSLMGVKRAESLAIVQEAA